jgi:hypothetical protein
MRRLTHVAYRRDIVALIETRRLAPEANERD